MNYMYMAVVTLFIFVLLIHYNDVIMSAMASQVTSLKIVYSTVYSKRISKKTSKLSVTGLCEGNSPVTGKFPAQRASNAENISIWWRHHEIKSRNISLAIRYVWIYDIYVFVNMWYIFRFGEIHFLFLKWIWNCSGNNTPVCFCEMGITKLSEMIIF